MELCPVTDTLGYAELLWTVRDLLRRPLSKRWMHHIGKVEGYESQTALEAK